MTEKKRIPKAEIDKIFGSNGQKFCEFISGAHNPKQFPNSNLKEFSFIGASNVGKSSLINALTSQKIAIVSNTPGRTRQVNFFKLSNRLMIVDMPGYGFAKAKDKDIQNWQKTSFEYFASRHQLVRVFLLIDPIKGLKESDFEMANIFNSLGLSFQIILTKVDKLNREEVRKSKEKIASQAKMWAALHPEIIEISNKKGYGIDDLKEVIVELNKQ